ncbi:molecular chaperone HtpG [Francisella philomiragia]|uniref:molecular chaperone HtpG n=1 Tax=Francisella philomiragia TaxID=28110 RepID=UPI0005A55EB8|nr:molecular chaperone HtpG [Francisella philomiragia]AJI54837.1 hsp90 family protein [Francisella philomiragia]MBK2025635.1 molecular chaperone HtpG [Francisella philomiragia]MBK2253154.1 molecular chaperone HtpG [Francisella philomiragia]MBK2296418.1 molecular chaperone HtpG [Francisella philomiragia]MBK2340885.1 molecular chaperone HtpG [Francisella philomiragia]
MSEKKYTFETEVDKLLHLVIHSLYSNREIFLRELVSNSSDAIEKLRYESISNAALNEDDTDYAIRIDFDKDAKTITVSDNGIGMTEEEVIENLGTIAKSGTKKFLESLTGDKSKDNELIGQFGVGFYSSFIVADKVTVRTRKAGQDKSQATKWVSDAQNGFTVETITKEKRGTEITLHIKEDQLDLLDYHLLKGLVNKYSDCINTPIQMKKVEHDKDGKQIIKDEYETVNNTKAIWLRSKDEVTDEEYQEFYKYISHDFADALMWIHNKVEGNLEYNSLLYIPQNKPFDFWNRDKDYGLSLYVRRVFIMENKELLPPYLRFVKGVIDSADLPLNVSREILQHNKVIDKIKKAITTKILSELKKLASKDTEKYQKFWDSFGQVLKEGVSDDYSNKEKIAGLLRFATTESGDAKQTVSLADYISRMKEGQDTIYYITSDSYKAAVNNPQLEAFKKKGIEVILMTDRIDEWMMSTLTEFDGKHMKSIIKGDIDLDKFETPENKEKFEKEAKDFEKVLKEIKEVLKDKVEDVRLSKRLTDSPSCVVVNDYGMSLHMQKMMEEAGQGFMPGMGMKPILELNAEHNLVQKLKNEADTEIFADLSELLLLQAMFVEGAKIEDPMAFVKLVNKYIK